MTAMAVLATVTNLERLGGYVPSNSALPRSTTRFQPTDRSAGMSLHGGTMDLKTLKSFCGDYITNSEPWNEGEYTYATDGFVLVRVPRMRRVHKNGNFVKVRGLYTSPMPLDGWVDIPTKETLGELTICPGCKGKSPAVCIECDGEGLIEFHNEFHAYEVECKSCDGTCSECRGEGVIEPTARCEILGKRFTSAYIRMFHGLPNCKIALHAENAKLAWIKFDGGDALIVPLTEAESW